MTLKENSLSGVFMPKSVNRMGEGTGGSKGTGFAEVFV